MSNKNPVTSQIIIKLDGAEIAPAIFKKLISVKVDQHIHLPGMFSISFHDSDLSLLDSGPFDLTKTVDVIALTSIGEKVILIKGEITALEPDFGEGMIATLTLRGYDKTHRLYRETKTQAFLNKKDSDLAEEIAKTLGVKSKIDPTETIHEHIFQQNQSDLAFLRERAWRIGFECFLEEEKLFFRKLPVGAAHMKLTWGEDLLSFRPRVSLSEQVDEVIVRGWDVSRQEAIVGVAKQGHLYPAIGESKNGAQWAKEEFGIGRQIFLNFPVIDQNEAEKLASARLDEISGAFLEAEGEAFRRPDIKVGRMIEINALGNRLSGNYLVTQVTHIYSHKGLKTIFGVRGSRTGLFTASFRDIASPKSRSAIAPAVVTNTDDPKDWGRVKVKFPWMADEAESDWARVLGAGAGPETGVCAIPEIDDEVLVAFVNGNFSQPYILGGLWNGKSPVPPEIAQMGSGKKPLLRTWHSRKGHFIAMYDDEQQKIEIKTSSGQCITLDDRNEEIIIQNEGQFKVSIKDDIMIETSANLTLKADQNISIEAGQNMALKAKQLTIEGLSKANLKAANVAIEGNAITEIKGALVKIN